jgi:hypothetical protein
MTTYYVTFMFQQPDGSWGFGDCTIARPVAVSTIAHIQEMKAYILAHHPDMAGVSIQDWRPIKP